MRNMTGRPVTESDFYNREVELADLWRKMETDHILLLAPRRVGKTSLMYKLLAEAPNRPNTFALYLSVPDIDTEFEFIERLYHAVLESPQARSRLARIWDRLKSGPIGKFFGRIESVGVPEFFEVGWREAKREEWETLGWELINALRELEGRWLIMVDELPVFVLNLIRQDPAGARARTFLYWLRQIRQMPPPEGERLRFLLAGSIGLDTVASRYRMGDAVNDLTIKTLGAFKPEIADSFLEALGNDYGLNLAPEVRRRICERAEWLIPYYLQLFFSGLLEICSDERAVPSVAMVDEVFDVLLSHGRRSYFDYWHQRLTEELGAPQDGWARALLNVCSRDASGVTKQTLSATLSRHVSDPNGRDEMLNWLIDVLIGDGYLIEEEGRYRFRSSLLREFWHRRFAL
jgi:uncharacterized protein